MDRNFRKAETEHLKEPMKEPRIIGKCKNCNKVLTEDYEAHKDYASHLFCSADCALEWYEVEEIK